MLTWQHTTVVVQHAPALVCSHNQQKKNIPGRRFPSAGPFCVRVTQMLPACWREHIPRHGGHPSGRRVALVRRCHLPVAGTDLAWKERRSDSPATKIRPFRCLEKRLTAPSPACLAQVHGTHKVKKEQSARVQARSSGLSAQICRTAFSMCAVIGEEKGGMVRGWGGGEAAL